MIKHHVLTMRLLHPHTLQWGWVLCHYLGKSNWTCLELNLFFGSWHLSIQNVFPRKPMSALPDPAALNSSTLLWSTCSLWLMYSEWGWRCMHAPRRWLMEAGKRTVRKMQGLLEQRGISTLNLWRREPVPSSHFLLCWLTYIATHWVEIVAA